jgi:hypothetical protein
MTKTLLNGRLVTDGTGRLFIHPIDGDTGEPAVNLHLRAEDGQGTDELIPGMVECTWDQDLGGFVELLPGEESHNERHHSGIAHQISGTSGPLYDGEGNLVYEGDPHHVYPMPNDPHYDEDAPNKTKTVLIPDAIASMETSHTEAYSS